MTAIGGADFAYVNHGFTAQAEATFLQFVRVRGEDGGGATDSFRAEAAVGFAHLGCFIGSHLPEQQSALSALALAPHDPEPGDRGAGRVCPTRASASTTVAVGPRFHFRVGKQG